LAGPTGLEAGSGPTQEGKKSFSKFF
jgi:hypothetical protein